MALIVAGVRKEAKAKKKKIEERTVQTTPPSSSCEGVAGFIWILRGVDIRVFLAAYVDICRLRPSRGG